MWLGNLLSLDDGIEGARAAENVVGLYSQHLTQSVTGAVTKKGPDFHLSETLTTILRLTTERLLSDEGVRTDRAHVYLVFDHVVQLENIHVTYGNLLIEGTAGATVEELDFARLLEIRFHQFLLDLVLGRTGKWRHDGLVVESMSRETQMHF